MSDENGVGGLLLDVEECAMSLVPLPRDPGDRLRAMYDAIGCELVEMHPVLVGGRRLMAVVDEEGLLRDAPRPSVMADGRPYLYGAVLLLGIDGEGEPRPLTDDELDAAVCALGLVCLPDGTSWPAVCGAIA